MLRAASWQAALFRCCAGTIAAAVITGTATCRALVANTAALEAPLNHRTSDRAMVPGHRRREPPPTGANTMPVPGTHPGIRHLCRKSQCLFYLDIYVPR